MDPVKDRRDIGIVSFTPTPLFAKGLEANSQWNPLGQLRTEALGVAGILSTDGNEVLQGEQPGPQQLEFNVSQALSRRLCPTPPTGM